MPRSAVAGSFGNSTTLPSGWTKNFDPVARLQSEMLTDRFRDRRLALAGDRGVHVARHYYISA